MQAAGRMAGVKERGRLAVNGGSAGGQESAQMVRVWAVLVRRAVMGTTGRTALPARNWVVGMSEGEKDEELAEEKQRWDRKRQEGAQLTPPGGGGAAQQVTMGAGSGLGAGAPAQVMGGGG